MQLTSAKNPRLQAIRRAAHSGQPTADGLVVAEGPHLLEEALGGEWRIEQIFATGSARDRFADLLSKVDAEIVEVSEHAFASIAQTESPQDVLALMRPRCWTWAELSGPLALIVILEGIQDPGNAGTIVRSAEAFGATGIVLLAGCVRASNSKFLRATAGSIFRMPFLEGLDAENALTLARADGLKTHALSPRGHTTLLDADLRSPCALAVGSEGSGLSVRFASEPDLISVPTARVESLNAGVACSIALFVAKMQRATS